jgi:drug/metabolite transporter (DMT)-like permease
MIPLLLSIACSTILLILFKFFGKYKVNNLHAIVVNYYVASITGFLFYTGDLSVFELIHQPWSGFAAFTGLLFISIFVIIAISSQISGIGITSVANKMSMVIPAIAAVYLFDEEINFLKGTGILLALIGVFLCTIPAKGTDKKSIRGVVLLLIIFFGSGFADTLMKYVEHNFLDENTNAVYSMFLFAASAACGTLILAGDVLIRKTKFELRTLFWGILLGIPNYFSVYFLIGALSQPGWDSSVIYPVNNMGIVILSALTGVLFFKERFSKLNLSGLIISIIAIGIIFFA